MKRVSLAVAVLASVAFPALADESAELKKLMSGFYQPGADVDAMMAGLRPSEDEYREVFADDVEDGAIAKYGAIWDSGQMRFPLKPERSEINITAVNIGDIRTGAGDARDLVAGGMLSAAQKMNPELTVYEVDLVEPGERFGTSLKYFMKVEDNWVIMPKPWRFLPSE